MRLKGAELIVSLGALGKQLSSFLSGFLIGGAGIEADRPRLFTHVYLLGILWAGTVVVSFIFVGSIVGEFLHIPVQITLWYAVVIDVSCHGE